MNPDDWHSALLKEPDSGKGRQKGKNDYLLIREYSRSHIFSKDYSGLGMWVALSP